MKVLLDECLDVRLRHHLPGHDAYTVVYMGWTGIKNGRLLALAAGDGFDAMVTSDAGIEHSQDLAALPLSIVILDVPSNDLDDALPLVPNLLAALRTMAPRTLIHVGP